MLTTLPNSIKAGPRFAAQLLPSIRMFGWDGIVMDSAISAHIATSTGFDRNDKKLTDLSAGEVGYRYLVDAYKQARAANPDFRFLSQNATSVSHNGVKEPIHNIYPWIARNADRLNIREYSKVVDLYTAEIDAHHEPRDGRYPLTYEVMSVSLNSLVEVLGRPLLAFAFLVKPGPENTVAFVRPYFATHLASRTHVHDHHAFYEGALSNKSASPAAQQFIQYNRFLSRYSYYLHDPQLKWLTNARERFRVTSPRQLSWDRTVYHRSLPNGGERIVINLLNLPSNGKILNQTEIPPVAQGATLQISSEMNPTRVVWISADDPSLKSMPLERSPVTKSGYEYALPPITCWGMVVIETTK